MTINLNANDYEKETLKIVCSDSIKKEFIMEINSNKLNLSQDAIQDNIGGYVDIPEDKYYLKTKDKLYYLNGVVETNYNNNINKFTSYINNSSNKNINIKELYNLKGNKNLKLIQKIILDNKNKTTDLSYKTTSNILNIYIDAKLFNKEYDRCRMCVGKNFKILA